MDHRDVVLKGTTDKLPDFAHNHCFQVFFDRYFITDYVLFEGELIHRHQSPFRTAATVGAFLEDFRCETLVSNEIRTALTDVRSLSELSMVESGRCQRIE